jgi:hypothetical protein
MQVEAISQQTDWRGIDLPTARRFMVGCNCDLTDRETNKRIVAYLRSGSKKRVSRFPYLRKSERWEAYYLPLVERFAQHLKQRKAHAKEG